MKVINFAEKRVNITNEEKVMHGNLFLTTTVDLRWKKAAVYLKLWALTMERRYTRWSEHSSYIPFLPLKHNKNNIGFYRDDNLAIFKHTSSPKSEKVKKDIQKFLKENELDIAIQYNMKTVSYLEVALNLENSTYRPYQKENNQNT